nr:MAG TPA: hypothetical protein [Caudoviricetes sp.]
MRLFAVINKYYYEAIRNFNSAKSDISQTVR